MYNLASAPKKTSKVTKGLAAHLKYCYGACVKRNMLLTADELSEKVYNVLDHICDIHNKCDVAWCYNMKAKESNKEYDAPREHRIDKVNDPVTFLQLRKILTNMRVSNKWHTVTIHSIHKLMSRYIK